MTYIEFLKKVLDTTADDELKEKAQELIDADTARKAKASERRNAKAKSEHEDTDRMVYNYLVNANCSITATDLACQNDGNRYVYTPALKRLVDAGKATRQQVAHNSRLVWEYTAVV